MKNHIKMVKAQTDKIRNEMLPLAYGGDKSSFYSAILNWDDGKLVAYKRILEMIDGGLSLEAIKVACEYNIEYAIKDSNEVYAELNK